MVKRLFALSLLWAAGCAQDAKPLTQLVLVADSNMAAVDHVEFVVSSPTHATENASALRTQGSAPPYLSLVHDEGPLGPVTVTARGLHGTTELLVRTHEVSFVQDQTRVVRLDLFERCIGVTCAADQTCAEDGCTPQRIDATTLPTWNGTPPTLGMPELDAGASDAGSGLDSGDGGAHSEDAGLDASAGDAALGDGAVTKFMACGGDGGLFDLWSDPSHCGKCSRVCKVDMEQCVAGNCVKK